MEELHENNKTTRGLVALLPTPAIFKGEEYPFEFRAAVSGVGTWPWRPIKPSLLCEHSLQAEQVAPLLQQHGQIPACWHQTADLPEAMIVLSVPKEDGSTEPTPVDCRLGCSVHLVPQKFIQEELRSKPSAKDGPDMRTCF